MNPAIEGLSLEQKAVLVSGRDFWSTHPIEDQGVPAVVLTDGPHGIRRQTGDFDHIGLNASAPATCFPPAVAVGTSWDPEVAARVGSAVGREARALGVHVALGPGVNIKRSPLCGRNFEYYSEDPLLAGVLAAAHVRGQQAEGVGASVKHFAANNQETDRMQVSVDVDERTLREIYLPAFERVVRESSPATVMCSYNRINGVHASQNRWLLTDVLRGDWGFDGAVVSDWGAVHDPVAAVGAGLDLEMPGNRGASAKQLVDAVHAGVLDETVLDAAVTRVLALTELAVDPADGFDLEGHHALARRLAAECAVLLKNEGGVLPLRSGTRVAVIGALAAEPRFQGGGSSHIHATRVESALDAVRAVAGDGDGDVTYAAGYTFDGTGEAADLLAEAVAVAQASEVALVFAGLGEQEESEGFDRPSLDLSKAQIDLIRDVAAAAPRTVVVLSNGGIVSVEGWHDEVDAILEGFLLGQAGGGALADLLFGTANPSGRLAETIPIRIEDNPSFVNFPGELGHVRYGEGVMVGYRWYTSVGLPARYPFGYGLSYTTFETGGLTVEQLGDDRARCMVTVSNTGDRPGRSVVQIYVSTEAGPVRRPARELRAFTKISLEPGESQTVSLELDRRAFAYYDTRYAQWVVAPGDYVVELCENAVTVVESVSLTLPGDDLAPILTLDSTLNDWFGHPTLGPGLKGALSGAVGGGREPDPAMVAMASTIPMQMLINMFGEQIPAEVLAQILEVAGKA